MLSRVENRTGHIDRLGGKPSQDYGLFGAAVDEVRTHATRERYPSRPSTETKLDGPKIR